MISARLRRGRVGPAGYPAVARWRPAALLAAILAALLGGCALVPAEPEEPPPTLPPPPVRMDRAVFAVRRGKIREEIPLQGRLTPVRSADLYFTRSGRLRAVYARAGEQVAAGQLLAELHSEETEYQLAQAEIRYQQAELALAAARREAARRAAAAADTTGGLAAAAEVARLELQKARERLAQGPTPEAAADLAAAEARYRQARAELERARTEQEQARAQSQDQAEQLRRLELDLEAARLEVERRRAELSQSQLVAPFAGQITTAAVRPGAAVEAYAPVLTLVDPAELTIEADVDTAALARVAVGQRVRLTFGDLPEATGTVVELPDPQARATRTDNAPLRIRVEPDAPLAGARMGTVGKVYVILQEKHGVLLLPTAALREYGDRTYVLLQEPRREVDVVVGVRGETEVEILRGLEEGDQVIGR